MEKIQKKIDKLYDTIRLLEEILQLNILDFDNQPTIIKDLMRKRYNQYFKTDIKIKDFTMFDAMYMNITFQLKIYDKIHKLKNKLGVSNEQK